MSTRRATIYLRMSLDRSGEGLGVERQELECRALCERNGWDVREVLTDNDISATKGKRRPAFEALLTSKPEAIVVWHTDRLVRLSKDLERVIDLAVNVYAVTAGHVDPEQPCWPGGGKDDHGLVAVRRRAEGRASEGGSEAACTRWSLVVARAPVRVRAGRHLARGGSRGLASGVLVPARWSPPDADCRRHQRRLGTSPRRVERGAQRRCALSSSTPRNAAIRVYEGEEIGPAAWSPIVLEETYRAAVRYLGKSRAQERRWRSSPRAADRGCRVRRLRRWRAVRDGADARVRKAPTRLYLQERLVRVCAGRGR